MILGMFEVRRRVERDLVMGRKNDIGFVRWLIGEEFGMGEMFEWVKGSENGIFVVFCISRWIVFGIRDRVNVWVLMGGRCVERNNGMFWVGWGIIVV